MSVLTSCPDDASFAALIEGGLSGDPRHALIDHAAECHDCRELLSALTVSTTEPSVHDLPLERYELLQTLGAGGMGVVYEAYDRELERRVALKLLRDDAPRAGAERSLLDEARAMAKLTHPNVVRVLDVGEHTGRVFVTMELARDGTLRDYLSAGERSFEEIIKVFVDAGRGLAAAHAAGLVHRDFKPENVLLRDGAALVTDFGLARVVRNAALPDTPGALSAAAGTLHYMAPEQLRREREKTDARADVFAFSVALWEALYGGRPFGGTTPAEVLAAIAEGPPRPPARVRVPKVVRDALVRGLASSRDDRLPSMDAMLVVLGAAMPGRDRRRHTWPLVLAAAAAAVAASVALLDAPKAASPAVERSLPSAASAAPTETIAVPPPTATAAGPAEKAAPPAVRPAAPRVSAPSAASGGAAAMSRPSTSSTAARGPGGVFVSSPY